MMTEDGKQGSAGVACIYRRSAGLGRESAVLYMAGREGKIAYDSR